MTIWNLLFSTYGILYMLNSFFISMMDSARDEAECYQDYRLRPQVFVRTKVAGLGMLVQIVSAIISSFQYEWWYCFILILIGVVVYLLTIFIFYEPLRNWLGRNVSSVELPVVMTQYSYGRERIIHIGHFLVIAVSILLFIFQFV